MTEQAFDHGGTEERHRNRMLSESSVTGFPETTGFGLEIKNGATTHSMELLRTQS